MVLLRFLSHLGDIINRSLIIFHEIGENSSKWVEYFKKFDLPNTNVVIPTANKIRLTYYKGNENELELAWFDYNGSNKHFEGFDSEGIKRAQIYAHNLIQEQINNGIPSTNVIVGGFSQGGALALYAGLTFPRRLAGIFAIGSWLPYCANFSESWVTHNRDIPIYMAHGRNDPIIPATRAWIAADRLRTISNNVTFNMYKDGSHTLKSRELIDMCNFIGETYGLEVFR